MSELVKWYCTELYPTNAEEEIGLAGQFTVYRAEDVALEIARLRGVLRNIQDILRCGYGTMNDECIEMAERVLAERQP